MILNRSFTGQVVNAGFQYVAPVGDSTPDAISGQSLTNVSLNGWAEFTPVQITGIEISTTASIQNGEFRVSTDGITYGAYSSTNQSVENTYWIQVRVNGPTTINAQEVGLLNVGGVVALFTANSAAVSWGAAYPYLRSVEWNGARTPNLIIGDSFRGIVTLNADSTPYDISAATSVKCCVVNDDHRTQLNEPSTLLSYLPSADWANGIVTLSMTAESTAQIFQHVKVPTFAKIEIQVEIDTEKYTWFAAVRLLPGFIE